MTTGRMPLSAIPPAAETMCLLGDAALDESLRQLRLERLDAAVRQQVPVEHDDVRTGAGDLEELVTIRQDEAFRVDGRDTHGLRRVRERERWASEP